MIFKHPGLLLTLPVWLYTRLLKLLNRWRLLHNSLLLKNSRLLKLLYWILKMLLILRVWLYLERHLRKLLWLFEFYLLRLFTFYLWSLIEFFIKSYSIINLTSKGILNRDFILRWFFPSIFFTSFKLRAVNLPWWFFFLYRPSFSW